MHTGIIAAQPLFAYVHVRLRAQHAACCLGGNFLSPTSSLQMFDSCYSTCETACAAYNTSSTCCIAEASLAIALYGPSQVIPGPNPNQCMRAIVSHMGCHTAWHIYTHADLPHEHCLCAPVVACRTNYHQRCRRGELVCRMHNVASTVHAGSPCTLNSRHACART